MKKALFLLLATWSIASACLAKGKPLPLADPFVFYEDGQYFAYGTTSDNGIQVYTSTDLEKWTLQGWALYKTNCTATRWYWAPEVYHVNGKYLMYFSGNEEIRAAWADSPYGPFKEIETGPMWPRGNASYNIDNHLYIDEDGTPYIFFVEGHTVGTSMAQLEPDLTTIKRETMHNIISPEQPWELLDGKVNEGPFVLKHNGLYYLTYSGNGYTCKDYALGLAIAENINGPWKKVDYNPILRRVHGLVGVGHHSFFTDKDGNLRIAFHAHKNDSTVHPRDMHIGYVEFKKARRGKPDILYIDPKRIIDCEIEVPKAKQLIWSDEFDGSGEPNWNVWQSEKGFERNEELQWYQPQNAYRQNGVLVLEAKIDSIPNPNYQEGSKEWRKNRPYAKYSSGSIKTRGKFSFLYGRMEVRARIPVVSGSWPAIWLLGNQYPWPSCGEIDVMEFYQVKGKPTILANACWGKDKPNDAEWNTKHIPYQHFLDKDPYWGEKFHIWVMDWDEHYIRIYLDGELMNAINLEKTYNGSIGHGENPFRKPQYVLLDLAVGGQQGGKTMDNAFPMRYEIDYVRVYQ